MKTNLRSGALIEDQAPLNFQYWEPLAIGNVYYVDSAFGSSSGPGTSPGTQAYATIDQAMAVCQGNNGDVIVVMPGHAETYTTTGTKLTADKAGVRIIGYGKGSSRPTFTFSHTGATWTISGNGVILENLLFVAGIDSVVTFATISGADVALLAIETRDTTDIEVITDFTVTGDRLYVSGLLKNGYTGGNANVRVLSLNGVDRALIEDCRFVTKVTTAIIGFVTTACTGIVIRDCVFHVDSTTDHSKNVIDTITGSTWSVHDSFDLGAGASFSGGSGAAIASDDISSLTTKIGTPANTGGTATLAAILGDPANVALAARLITIRDALFDSTGIASYPAAAAAANGVSLAEVIRYIEDILVGTAGVVTWASGAAPANGVSLSEALRYVAENVINGGTVLPGTCSIYDVLAGANGIPTFPTAAAPANAVSIAEVVRAIYNAVAQDSAATISNITGLGRMVSKTEDVQAAGADLFTVTGKVLITLMAGEVTNAIGATVVDYKLRIKTDNIDLCSTSVLATLAVGTLLSLTGDATDSLVTAAEGIKTVDHSDSGTAHRIVGLAGGSCTIQSTHTAGDASDAIVWTLWYIPLEAGASVAAA